MQGRRVEVWFVLGLLLSGCDRAAEAELAGMRAELAATSTLLKEQGQRIETLTVELEKARAERAACEADRSRPVRTGSDPWADPSDPASAILDEVRPTLTATCADGTCVVKRSELDAFLANPAAMARQVRVVPAVEDGKPAGLKLFAIRAESLLARVGFKNGDVVRTIAGFDVSDADAAMSAYAELRKLDRWTIAGVRKGAPFEVTIVFE
ncbi:hypothetical protein [Nannocystis punicea]|uniref:PDZ domain-containing protein n=1 Tax=Nannocystis punicea TaxID=2995304 RepID=A0ABY7HFN1_9BACT|nr:hypothetical protein [Nannocystis poenicansa]WAS98099.1 hypothetical protein O0S08_18325 [Nannocystis poenicansa]